MRDERRALAAAEAEFAERFAPRASCSAFGRDYLKLAVWAFALLFGPALVALTVLIVSGLT